MAMIRFEHGAPVVGGYLKGRYSWPHAVRLSQVELRCQAPGTPCTLGLEVGGVLSGLELVIPPSSTGQSLLRFQPGLVVVPAETEVRWKVLACAGTLPQEVGMTVAWGWNEVLPGLAMSAPRLWLKYANPPEMVDVFDYVPGTQQFTERSAGIATGRCAVVNSTDFSLSIQGTPVLWMDAGVLKADLLLEDVEALVVPRVEFWHQSADGVKTVVGWVGFGGEAWFQRIQEATPTASADVFVLRGGSATKATIGLGGLVADLLAEG